MNLEDLLTGVGLSAIVEIYKQNRKMMQRIDGDHDIADILAMQLIIPDYMGEHGEVVRFRKLEFSKVRPAYPKTQHTMLAMGRGARGEAETAILLIPSGTER